MADVLDLDSAEMTFTGVYDGVAYCMARLGEVIPDEAERLAFLESISVHG